MKQTEISKKLEKALNEQINEEFYSAYLYLAMADFCETLNLPGFSHWLQVQAQEELGHGMKFFHYLNERGVKVKLSAIQEPPVEFGSALEVFQGALEHEKKITNLINNLYKLATEEGDYATQVMLEWFINEQVEEENSTYVIVEQLNTIGTEKSALLILDSQLGARKAE